MSTRIFVVHGPNLNLLGTREPEIYGSQTLADINARLAECAKELGIELHTAQHNGEGELIELVQQAGREASGLVINPGGYTHTSVALHDAIRGTTVPTVEVHLSNLYARDAFRHNSVTGSACRGVIMGFGSDSYLLGLRQLTSWVLGVSKGT